MYLQFESHPVDAEFVRLMHDLHSTEIVGHKYRGYTLLAQDGSDLRSIKVSTQ
jgi:fatty acid synthase